jgi:transcriptional regulator with XRE-family HTH domain
MNTQDWPGSQTARIGQVIRQLRKDQHRSAQQVADRTRELGCEVPRTAITDLEIGRRKNMTIAELTVLARALNTSPVALMFPGPYYETVEVLPGLEVRELRAVQWFSGLLSGPTEHLPAGGTGLTDDRAVYTRNLRRLRLAREVWNLEEGRFALMTQLGATGQSPDERAQVNAALADLQRQIDEKKADDVW